MALEIKEKIEELVNKIKNDKDLGAKFAKDPIATVEGLLGVDLPDEQMKAIVEGIKAKLGGEGGVIGKIGEKIGGIFGKEKE
ncbi:MAG: hypothetical protein IKE57_03000 [Oscillospiraceae bacterium]|nr:hypothetical protein [Oscillospiraceae bacterium]